MKDVMRREGENREIDRGGGTGEKDREGEGVEEIMAEGKKIIKDV